MSIWDSIASPIISIINKIVPDKTAAAQAVATLQQMQLEGKLSDELLQLQSVTSAQSDINKIEAASPSIFVAGGRPAIMWICAAALCSQYLLRPFILWGFALAHQPAPILPGLDDNLWQLIWGMLGMGALRSFDKVKGTATAKLA